VPRPQEHRQAGARRLSNVGCTDVTAIKLFPTESIARRIPGEAGIIEGFKYRPLIHVRCVEP